jgi:hypothetical protein
MPGHHQADRAGRAVDVFLSGVSAVIFRQQFLDGIRSGRITIAFRRWRRPSVKAGGKLLTAAGLLHIRNVIPITIGSILEADARRAGYESRQALVEELNEQTDGKLYRIEIGALEADPRIALRKSVPDSDGLDALAARLRRLDAHARGKPWTVKVLETIAAHPAVRAGDLCGMVGQEKMVFKLNVRKLKALGLTESLEIGYRLSPRGQILLRRLRDRQ